MFVDGVRRPSKSKSTCLIPCSHNHSLITIPFTPAAPQGFSPSSTIYTHAPPTILGQWQYYILPAHYPCVPLPSLRFFDPQISQGPYGCMYLSPPMYIPSPNAFILFI